MAYTDQDLLGELQQLTLEPTIDQGATWDGGLWTLEEILGYANQRQQRFIGASQIVAGWYQQSAGASADQPLDDEFVFLRHAIWEGQDGACRPLPILSQFSTDLVFTAGTAATPQGVLVESTGTLTLTLVPTPIAVGVLHLFAVVLAEVLDRSGILLTVPDEWVPYLRFGVLADLFAKQGHAYDAARRDYCEGRFEEGIASARATLEALG